MGNDEGVMYQRLPDGTAPSGMSVRGPGGRTDVGTVGAAEHVTVYDAQSQWRRSWDNPGPTGDHSTNQVTGDHIQHR